MFILAETSLDVDPDKVPKEVGIVGEAGPLPVHTVERLMTFSAASEVDTFYTKLLLLVEVEGKSMEDFQALAAENQAHSPDVNIYLVTVIGKLVDKCNQVSADGLSYRKLGLFSDFKPVPQGEENYEAWMARLPKE